jgi:hypothetical protein
MKKIVLLVVILLANFTYSQHNYDLEGAIYSHSDSKLTLGTSTIQGNYDLEAGVLEVKSQNPTKGSFLGLFSGQSTVFLSASPSFNNGLHFSNNKPFVFYMSGGGINEIMRLQTDGSVSIGTQANPTDYKLAVGGKIIAEAVRVELEINWPDYVFTDNYNLYSIDKLASFIAKYGHLPNIPSAEEIKEEGIDLGNMQAKQMEKIEELTLYIIQLKNELDVLKEQVNLLTNKQ